MLEVAGPLLGVPALYSVTKEGVLSLYQAYEHYYPFSLLFLLVSLVGIIARAASKSLNSRYLTCTCHEFSRAEWHLTVSLFASSSRLLLLEQQDFSLVSFMLERSLSWLFYSLFPVYFTYM